jgi:hypothetical protein
VPRTAGSRIQRFASSWQHPFEVSLKNLATATQIDRPIPGRSSRPAFLVNLVEPIDVITCQIGRRLLDPPRSPLPFDLSSTFDRLAHPDRPGLQLKHRQREASVGAKLMKSLLRYSEDVEHFACTDDIREIRPLKRCVMDLRERNLSQRDLVLSDTSLRWQAGGSRGLFERSE